MALSKTGRFLSKAEILGWGSSPPFQLKSLENGRFEKTPFPKDPFFRPRKGVVWTGVAYKYAGATRTPETARSGPKNHDSHRCDRILRSFLRPEIGQFSPHFRAISLPNYTVKLEQRANIHRRKFKKIQKRNCSPNLQMKSVPCRGRTCPDKMTLLKLPLARHCRSQYLSNHENHKMRS